MSRVLREYVPGTPVRVVTPASQSIFYGVVASLDPKTRAGSPAAPNSWKIRILVADAARQLTVPLSKFNSGREGAVVASIQEQDWFGYDIYSLFDQQQDTGRIKRQIFTGNLIRAFEKYPSGKLVNYTDNQGNVCQGLIMPRGFDIQEELSQEPVAFKEPAQVMTFITELTNRNGAVKTLDERVILKAQRNGEGFLLQTPATRESGGKYFLDEAIITAAGCEFYSVSDRMEVVIPPHRLEQTLNVLMKQRKYTLAAFDDREIAREYLGIRLPELDILVEGHQQDRNPVPSIREPRELLHTNRSRSSEASPESSNFTVAPTDKTIPTSNLTGSHRIALANEQKGILEKRIARFLETAGIRQAVMTSNEFHLKIENAPYIPLVVERHGNELFLTHYLSQNGDTFIDSRFGAGSALPACIETDSSTNP